MGADIIKADIIKKASRSQNAAAPLSDLVYQQILDAIYDGRLPPGSTINEVALAAHYGVSRGPVREAIRRLQGIQLVTRAPYLKAKVIELHGQVAVELFQLRMALEGMACYLATKNLPDTEIELLLHKLEQSNAAPSHEAGELVAFDFHEHIVRSCGNARIIQLLCGDLYHLLRLYRRHSGNVRERKEEAFMEHWQIGRAMKARDAHLAESLMRAHIQHAADHLFQRLDENS